MASFEFELPNLYELFVRAEEKNAYALEMGNTE